jgi:N-formylglutamate deformylase
MKNMAVIHIPHSSTHVPDDIRKDILLSDSELEKELLAITDKYTDELFACADADIIKNAHSRLVFDPERFRSDNDEIMSGVGMGAIYTSTVDGKPMRSLTDEKREKMMERFYDPYHKMLEEKVDRALAHNGKCLLIDGHSFPEIPLPMELDQNSDRPDICIGTCDFHTPEKLAVFMEAFVKSHGMSVRRNSPFSGTMVPMKFYRKDARVSSVMIEVNRKLYMDETTGEKLPSFHEIRLFVKSLTGEMIREFTGNLT